MTCEFIYFEIFNKNWHDLGLNDADLVNLEKMNMNNPTIGKIINYERIFKRQTSNTNSTTKTGI